jgi:hypothetical protein
MTSPAGTRIPRDGTSLVDGYAITWTIDAGFACCNGKRTNGHAAAIDWDGTVVRVLSPTAGLWWLAGQAIQLKWTALSTTDPDPKIVPPPPPPPPPVFAFPDPLSLQVGVPVPLAPFASLPVIWPVLDTPDWSLAADGMLTAKLAGAGVVSGNATPL